MGEVIRSGQRPSFKINIRALDATHKMGARLWLRQVFPRRNVLIQTEEVIGIVLGLDGYDAIPSLVISLRHTILFIAAHEVYIHSRFHCGPEFVEECANPGNIPAIRGRL